MDMIQKILSMNNAGRTMVWVDMTLMCKNCGRVLCAYHPHRPTVSITFYISPVEEHFRLTCEKTLQGKRLCVIDTFCENEDAVLTTVASFLRFGFGGIV